MTIVYVNLIFTIDDIWGRGDGNKRFGLRRCRRRRRLKSAVSSNGSISPRATASSSRPTARRAISCCIRHACASPASRPPMRAPASSARLCKGPRGCRREAPAVAGQFHGFAAGAATAQRTARYLGRAARAGLRGHGEMVQSRQGLWLRVARAEHAGHLRPHGDAEALRHPRIPAGPARPRPGRRRSQGRARGRDHGSRTVICQTVDDADASV